MMAGLKIEKRVPLPKTAGMTAAMKKMAIGDSFVLPTGIHPYGTHGYAKAAGIKITVRRQKSGSYRVWRTA